MEFKLADININLYKKLNLYKCLKNLILPLYEKNNKIVVLAVEENELFFKEIEFIFSKKIELIIKSENFICEIIRKIFVENIENLYEDLLKEAIIKNSSDIHFEPNENNIVVRYRIDGFLSIMKIITFKDYEKLIGKIKVQGGLNITENRRPQDGKMLFKYNEKTYDIRISTINTIYGENLVLRVLYSNNFNYSLDELNFNENQIKSLNSIIKSKNGVVIISGPTGSGKSTTLYTILNLINKENVNIVTLEDPVEVSIKGINQVALNKNIELDFSSGLRSILRQDPDIIMIGEIRDSETAKIAIRAGTTGHKVYSTIHTKSSKEVYLRLEDMGVESYLIKDSLVGVISQRLVRKLCSNCKKKSKLMKLDGHDFFAYESSGCEKCNFIGYKGRALVSCIFHIDKNIKYKLRDLYDNDDFLNNNDMFENIRDLFINGSIQEIDFLNFLSSEDINYEYKI